MRLTSQFLAWLLFLAICLAYAMLACRQQADLGSLELLPRGTLRFLDQKMAFRNLWAFALLGVFAGTLLKVRVFGLATKNAFGLLLLLLALPVLKEFAQLGVSGRHGNVWGAILGIAGMFLGLCIGQLIRSRFTFPVSPTEAACTKPDSESAK